MYVVFLSKNLSFFVLVLLPFSISIIGVLSFVPYFLIVGPLYAIMTLVYGLYPLRYGAVPYFENKGIVNALTEYEFIKKIIYFEIPILVVIAIITYPIFFIPESNPSNLTSETRSLITISEDPKWGFFAPINTLTYAVTAGILWIAIQTRKKTLNSIWQKHSFKLLIKRKIQ